MNSERFNWLRKSLSGQLVTLLLLFLIVSLAYVMIPLLSSLSEDGPLERTRRLVQLEAVRIMNAELDQVPTPDSIKTSGILADITAVNPDFRFFTEAGDQRLQIGADPRWRHTVDSVDSEAVEMIDALSSGCGARTLFTATLDEDGIPARVLYRKCGGIVKYVEFGGIVTPIKQATAIMTVNNLRESWERSHRFVIGALGVTLIAFLIFWRATRSLRRLAAVAESFDAEMMEHVLPEDGLPSEMVPLIRALNQMMHRIDVSHEQQAFFLATAAHEMRTPMAILRNRLEDLPQSVTKDELRNDIRRITKLGNQLLQLMSVRNRGALEGEVDLVVITKSVVADLAPISIEKGVDIELEAEIPSLPITGDEGLIHVAVANVIDNALSFSKLGDTLTVRVDAGRRVTVCDQGPGLAEETIDKVFEPFVKNPPNRNGHGLGLAIVKAIVILHGGDVFARNAPAGGAEFELQF